MSKLKIFLFILTLSGVCCANIIAKDRQKTPLEVKLTQKPHITSTEYLLDGSFAQDLEQYYQDQFFFRDPLLADYYFINQLLQRNQFGEGYVYQVRGGEDILLRETPFQQDTLDKSVWAMQRLHEFLQAQNIPFYTYGAPSKEQYHAELLPSYMHDKSAEIMEYLHNAFLQAGVPYQDLTTLLATEFDNQGQGKNVHFKTDHHWKPEAAFFGYQHILDTLIHDGVLSETYRTTQDNFLIEPYADTLSGSQGRGMAYGYKLGQSLDDFNLVIPKEEGSYTVKDLNGAFVQEGSAVDLLQLDLLDGEPYRDSYVLYAFGSHHMLTNNMLDNDKTVLLVGDSYMWPVSWFLAQNFEHVVVSFQRYNDPGASIHYIEQYQPDVVIGLNYMRSFAVVEDAFRYFE